jgi:hypothetical protein
MHPKSVAQRYKMCDDLAKTVEVCLEVLPKIMRVPPEVIAFPVPERVNDFEAVAFGL